MKTIYNPNIIQDALPKKKQKELLAKMMGVSVQTIYNWNKNIGNMRLVDYVELERNIQYLLLVITQK